MTDASNPIITTVDALSSENHVYLLLTTFCWEVAFPCILMIDRVDPTFVTRKTTIFNWLKSETYQSVLYHPLSFNLLSYTVKLLLKLCRREIKIVVGGWASVLI